jgi:two-component system sensor histidine kinase ResE
VSGYRIGMRWWLGGIFVLIATLSAALVATVSSRLADVGVRSNSEDIAVGKTVSAAFAVEQAIERGDLDRALRSIAARRDIGLFVFGPDGRPLISAPAAGVAWTDVPERRAALAEALRGRRYVHTSGDSDVTVTALPLHRTDTASALVSYGPRAAAYGRSLDIFRRELVRAALWAVLVAAVAGLVAATLIARRLRRIDAAATAIERGDFDVQLRPRLRDEVGSLALSIDRMRRRLRVSFEQLRGERDRLGRLLEQLHEGVVAVDRDLVVQFANRAARRMISPAPAPGAELQAVWLGLDLHELAAALFRDRAVVTEARVGEPESVTISVVGVPAGGSELAVLVLSDITEQERRERAEREFVANASHELRTPVAAIVSAVEALQSGAKESPADRDAFVELIERQATRLSRLTHSLLLLARAQSQHGELQLEPVDVRGVFEEVAATANGSAATGVHIDCEPGLTTLAQREIVEQVVANLLGNALKHVESGDVELSARRDGDNVVVEVTDSGPGIPPEEQQQIFDRFSSGRLGRRDGFGLGLAIVRDAVRALGGSVEIDSRLGRGTTVRVTLAAERRA